MRRGGVVFAWLWGYLACAAEPDRTSLYAADGGPPEQQAHGDADSQDGPTESVVSVAVGGGQLAFEPLANGEHVVLIAGFQGAHHIWISLGLRGFEPGNLQMHLSTRWLSVEESVREVTGRVAQRPPQDSGFDSLVLGWPALLYQAQCSHQQRVRIAVEVWDEPTGKRAADELVVQVDVPIEERLERCD